MRSDHLQPHRIFFKDITLKLHLKGVRPRRVYLEEEATKKLIDQRLSNKIM